MQNLDPSIEALLVDESFLNYCRGENEQDILYWQNYLAENPGQKELIEEASRQYRLLFNTIAHLDVMEQLERLKHKIESNEAAPVYVINNRPARNAIALYAKRMMVAAAAVMLLIAGYNMLLSKKATVPADKGNTGYASKPGEKKIIQLPDGTQVTMNAGSELSLNDNYGQNTREVFLKGEAFFDVQHNKQVPFIVHAADMDVRALGTAFNVRSYAGDKTSETALIRGLVEITLKRENKKIVLRPNEKICCKEDDQPGAEMSPRPAIKQLRSKEQIVIAPVKKLDDGTAQELAWTNNNLVFDNESFDEIALRLERWYGVKIIFQGEDIKQYHFSATFKKEKLERVMEILKNSKAFTYQFNGTETITIHH